VGGKGGAEGRGRVASWLLGGMDAPAATHSCSWMSARLLVFPMHVLLFVLLFISLHVIVPVFIACYIYMYVGYVHCNQYSIVKSTDVNSLFCWTLYSLIERLEVIPINLNWYAATRYCQKRQGHLVVIQDEKKQVIVEEMLAQTLHKRASCK